MYYEYIDINKLNYLFLTRPNSVVVPDPDREMGKWIRKEKKTSSFFSIFFLN